MRVVGAAFLAVTAAVHAVLVPEHLAEAPYAGVLFAGLAAVCSALAAALLILDTPAVWRVAAAVSALAVLGYVASRSVGLPRLGDDIGNWLEPQGIAAVGAEVGVILLAVARGLEPGTASRTPTVPAELS